MSWNESLLCEHFRKLGAPIAVTGMAHKLARIIYALLSQGRNYGQRVGATPSAAPTVDPPFEKARRCFWLSTRPRRATFTSLSE
jgi:hypothetical protein